MSNFWVDSFPASVPGGTVYGGGGYGTADMLTARDPLDAKRMAAGFAPGASYPDGYLGNITDPREDRMLGSLQGKLTSRSYQRGVHKGDVVGAQAYLWDQDMDPMMGIERQMAAVPQVVEGGVVMMTPKFAPTGNPVETLVHDGKTAMMDPRQQDAHARQLGVDTAKNPVMVTDPARAVRMRQSLPRWSGVFQA